MADLSRAQAEGGGAEGDEPMGRPPLTDASEQQVNSAAVLSMNVAPFLFKTWNLVNDPATDAVVSWAPDGLTFVVHRPDVCVRAHERRGCVSHPYGLGTRLRLAAREGSTHHSSWRQCFRSETTTISASRARLPLLTASVRGLQEREILPNVFKHSNFASFVRCVPVGRREASSKWVFDSLRIHP